MLGTPLPHHGHTPGHKIAHAVGWILVVVAAALTMLLGYMLVEALTGTYIGGELAIVWALTGLEAVLTAGTWTAAAALLRTGHSL